MDVTTGHGNVHRVDHRVRAEHKLEPSVNKNSASRTQIKTPEPSENKTSTPQLTIKMAGPFIDFGNTICRPPHDNERDVMQAFASHASRCPLCEYPLRVHMKGNTLCDRGHAYARDVAQYVYSKAGKAYSVVDRNAADARVQIEIPPRCDAIQSLLKAVDQGLKIKNQALKPAVSHDRTYHVPGRKELPERRDRDDVLEVEPRTRDKRKGPGSRDRRRETVYVTSGRGSLYKKDEEVRRRRQEMSYFPSGRGNLFEKDEELRRRRKERGEPVINFVKSRRQKGYRDSKTSDGKPSLSAPVVSAATVIPSKVQLAMRAKDDQTSSLHYPQPEGETNRAIEVTEVTARCIERTKDIVVATDSKPWEPVMSSIGSQSRSSGVDMHVIADGSSNEAAGGLGALIDALCGRTADKLRRSAQKAPPAISTCEKSSGAESIDAEGLLREAIWKDEISSLNVAPGHSCVVGQLSPTTGLISLDAGDGNDAQTTISDRGHNDEEGFSQQEFSSDDDLGSDLSIVAYEKRRILDSLMEEFNNTFSSGASSSFRSQSERSEHASSSNAANQPASLDQGPQGCSSISAGKKRAQSQDPFSEDEDDGCRKREKKSKSASSTTAPARLLACPFNKHDPKIYSASNKATRKFRACGGPGWETVARLKEHLYRVHYKPFQCARCWLTTKTAKELEEHARVPMPCSVQPQVVAWISHDKYDQLKDRKNKHHPSQSEEERWICVYAVLFPEDLSPPGAYYEHREEGSAGDAPRSPLSRNFAAFQQYSQENLPGRVREHLVALMDHRMVYVEESLKSAIPDIVRACQAQLYNDWERSTMGVDQENEGDTLTSSSERKEAASRAFHSEPLVSEPPALNASLSTFFVEPTAAPASLPNQNMFNDAFQSGGNGEGSSSTTTDSGYDSLGWSLGFVSREPPPSPTQLFARGRANSNLFLEDRRDAGANGIVLPIVVSSDESLSTTHPYSRDESLTVPLDFDVNDLFSDYGLT